MSDKGKSNRLKTSTTVLLSIANLVVNEGQMEGLPANPRSIQRVKFELLKRSIKEHPEFLIYNPLKVYHLRYDKYLIIGGNMRFQALQQLGYSEVPCAIIDKDTPIEELRAYTILDNSGFGQWDWDMITNEWDANDVQDWGVDFPVFDEEDEEEKNKADEDEDEKLTITIPREYKARKDEIISTIQSNLTEYQGIKIK